MNKVVKRTLIASASIIGTVILLASSYVAYVFLSYNRIEDNLKLEVTNNSKLDKIDINTTYKATTYNIGFGAYSQDFTFFLDTGYDANGEATCGYYSKAFSKDDVLFNVNGSIKTIKDLDVDFALFQEVDTNSTRSYHVDQSKMINDSFTNYDSTFAVNFHSAFLPYPLYDMHGKSNAGIQTLSKYKIKESTRKSYTISTSFSKFFDLDRCFSINVIEVSNGKNLYLVNSHMSAYDSGGTIRAKQVEELNYYLKKWKDEGHYVIVGGDYNHDLLTYNPEYNYTKDSVIFKSESKTPDWIAYMFDESGNNPYVDGYFIVAADNKPSSRNNDIAWSEGITYTCVVDGYIVSDNIKITYKENIETKNGKLGVDGFAYSDHQPVYIEFELK